LIDLCCSITKAGWIGCWVLRGHGAFIRNQNEVKSVSIKSTISQNEQDNSAATRKLVLMQIKAILSLGPTLWPNVNDLSVDLPGEGTYLDVENPFSRHYLNTPWTVPYSLVPLNLNTSQNNAT